MKTEIKQILIIIITFILLFGISFLLDLKIIQQNKLRQFLVYFLFLIQLVLSVNLFKEVSK